MNSFPPQQMSLGVSLDDDATFDNFYTRAEGGNAQLLETLRRQLHGDGEAYIYLWGAAGVGLTHLLQAACHESRARALTAQYLPLRDMAGFAPQALLDGLESVDLLCLDDLQAVVGQGEWDRALFHLFNRLRENHKYLLAAAHCGPSELGGLADLASRLRSGVVFQVAGMTDTEKQAALQLRARARGLVLNDEVAQYILHRAPRDTSELFYCLNRLDDASLAQQRRLTIPFVKRVLNL